MYLGRVDCVFLTFFVSMKILMLCEFYNPALEFQENLLVKYYKKHDHDVVVVTSTYEDIFDYYSDSPASKTASISEDRGAKIIRLAYSYDIMHRLRAYTSITSILEDEQPDLIFVHDIMLNLPECVRYVKNNPTCRMILDYHADYSNSGKNALSIRILHSLIRKWFLDRARPHLSKIFPIVPASTQFLHEIYKVPLEEMEVLPLGADIDLVNSLEQLTDRQQLRKDFGFSDGDIVIFAGGKIEPKRCLESLFSAVELNQDLPLQVIVAGKAGPSFKDYEQHLIDSVRHMSNIKFLGWLESEDIYKKMLMSDLAVFPASQSILWQRAIAVGLPLICGNTGFQDISYLNDGNISILSADQINMTDIAAAIRRVVTKEGCMDAMRVAAKRVANERLDWNRLIEKTLQFN
jgi:1,2-diacylglycerol 3-alpha-glucosyltransferase